MRTEPEDEELDDRPLVIMQTSNIPILIDPVLVDPVKDIEKWPELS